MSWLSPGATALIDEARRGLGPSAGDTARIRERLAARLPAGALVPAAVAGAAVIATREAPAAVAASVAPAAVGATTGVAAGVATQAGLGLAAKLALYLGSVAMVAVGVHAYDTRPVPGEAAAPIVVRGPAPPAPPPSLIVVPIAVPLPFAVPAPAPRLEVAPRAAPAPLVIAPEAPAPALLDPRTADRPVNAEVVPAEPPADLRDPLTRELALVRTAAAALRAGNAVAAIEEIDVYEHAFPSGQLAEEAAAIRVRALCATDPAAAAAARYRFAVRWPRSAQRAAVDHACPSLPAP